MAEISGFHNSVNGDRRVKADFFARFFGSLIGNGVFPNPSTGLQVIANGDMTVTVKAGKGWINGVFYENTVDMALSLDVADGVLKRIDRVVLQYSTIDRTIEAKVKKGTFASSPVAPVLQRDADAYELGLADIYVANGAVSISQGNITDLRLNNSYCGVVTGLIDQVDGETLFIQFQAIFDDFMESLEGVLDDNAAGNLLNLINDLVSKMGSITSLTTTEKSNLVGAINELVSGIADIELDLSVHTTAISNNAQDIASHAGSSVTHVATGDRTSWNGKIDKSLMTAAGDLIYGSAANTPARLAKGTDGQVLTLASGLPIWGAGVKIASGSYSGNSTSGRQIQTGFDSKFVYVYEGRSISNPSRTNFSIDNIGGVQHGGSGHNFFANLKLSSGGFTVAGEANAAGYTYYYLAIG